MKKIVSALLCVCLAALLALPAAAKDLSFTDSAAIRNRNAVTMMADLGLVGGYTDGAFRPVNNIRRAEAAKLIALVCEPNPATGGVCSFWDCGSSWAKGYIAYCAKKGIISGGTNGAFRPDDFVTARELAKMLLTAIGYDGGRYTGAKWAVAVDADADRLGIYSGYDGSRERYISRDDACLLLYNAMQCYAVSGENADGSAKYVLDDLMNPVTYMEARFRIVRFSSVLEANEYADLTVPAGRLGTGKSRLSGHAPLSVATDYTMLGRTVDIYTVRSVVGASTYYTVIGIPSVAAAEKAFTASSVDEYNLLLRYSEYRTSADTAYYINFDRANDDFIVALGDDCTVTAVDLNGDEIIDEVLCLDYTEVTVTSADPMLIAVGSDHVPAVCLAASRPRAGERVRCLKMGGGYYIP